MQEEAMPEEAQQAGPTEAEVIKSLLERMAVIEGAIEQLVEFSTRTADSIKQLERSELERKAAWLGEIPAHRAQPQAQIFRPREQAQEGEMTAQERANQIVASKARQ